MFERGPKFYRMLVTKGPFERGEVVTDDELYFARGDVEKALRKGFVEKVRPPDDDDTLDAIEEKTAELKIRYDAWMLTETERLLKGKIDE